MSDKTKSLVFDVFQIGSLVFILLTGPVIASSIVLTFFQLLAVFTLSEAVWEMRKTKFYRVPDVGKQNSLVTTGIYAYVRHPMYLAQLLFCIVLIVNSFSWFRFLVWFILLANFIYKIRYEEKLLGIHFSAFAEYRKTSWRLFPFIY